MCLPSKVVKKSTTRRPRNFLIVKNISDGIMLDEVRKFVDVPDDKPVPAREYLDRVPAGDGGKVPSLLDADDLFHVRALDRRTKRKENHEKGEPLHKFGVDLFFSFGGEPFTGSFSEFALAKNESQAFRTNFHSPSGHLFQSFGVSQEIRCWTKVLVYWFTDQNHSSIESFETRYYAQMMNMTIPINSSASDIMKGSLQHISTRCTMLAFENGVFWKNTSSSITITQYFLLAILFPGDWRHLYWGCHGILCCFVSCMERPHLFYSMVRSILVSMNGILDEEKRERVEWALTSAFQSLPRKIKEM